MASDPDRRRFWLFGAGGALAFLVLALQVWAHWPPPQMQTDEQVFNTVDALFTALTARDTTQLNDCARRLKTYHAEGRMSDAVADRLDEILEQARGGEWEPAAHTLYDFILGQRGGA
ncbi:MAG: hypothetical protein U0992_14945 [Planctomycetaceae bacterium]